MSLTENFMIIPDFYYNDSGIPTLYNNDKFNNPVTTTKLKKASKTTGYQIKISTKSTENLNLEQKIKRKSLIPLSVRSTPPPTPSLSSPFLSSKSFFKNSTLLLQHKSHNNNSNNNNNNNSVTPLITKYHKTTTPATMMKTISKTRVTTKALTTIKNPYRLDNNINNNSSSDIYIMNNYCDKNNQNIFKKKYEIPKKLLTKRATIYQNFEELPLSSATLLQQQQQQESPSSFSSTETIDTATMLPFTKIMITKNFSNKKSYELINSNNNGNNYHNGTKKIILNTLMNEFENDKERKNYVNYKIKELNCSKRSKILENYENYNYYLQQQSLNTSDNLNCPKYDDVTNKKYQQNNNNIQENTINRQLDNRITYDMTTKIIKF